MKTKHIFYGLFILFLGLILFKPSITLAWDNVQVGEGGEYYLFYGASFCLKVQPGAKLASMNAIVGESSGLVILTGAYLNETQRSSITLISPGRQILSNSLNLETNCETNRSTLTITWGPTTPEIVTIIPSGNFCPGGQGDTSVCFSSQEPTPPTPPTPQTQTYTSTGIITVSPSLGGETTYTNPNGGSLKLIIPPQAVSTETEFNVPQSYISSCEINDYFLIYPHVYTPYAFNPTNGDPITSFNRPLTLIFNYTDDQIQRYNVDEKTLTVYYFDANTNSCIALPTILDPGNNTATADTARLFNGNVTLAGKRIWTPPGGYEYITESAELKFYKNIIVQPGTNKKYGVPKIPNWKTLNPSVKDKILKSPNGSDYEYITGTWALPSYKNIITEPGGIKKYGIRKTVWTIPESYKYIESPAQVKFYKNIITKPGTGKKYGIPIFNLTDTGKPICKKDGKPIIRLFSTTWCPHCNWIKDIFDKVAKEYVQEKKIVAYHWQLDQGLEDDTLTTKKEGSVSQEEMAIFQEFSPQGSIPTFIFSCRYYRIGNAYESEGEAGKIKEEKELRKIINILINY